MEDCGKELGAEKKTDWRQEEQGDEIVKQEDKVGVVEVQVEELVEQHLSQGGGVVSSNLISCGDGCFGHKVMERDNKMIYNDGYKHPLKE